MLQHNGRSATRRAATGCAPFSCAALRPRAGRGAYASEPAWGTGTTPTWTQDLRKEHLGEGLARSRKLLAIATGSANLSEQKKLLWLPKSKVSKKQSPQRLGKFQKIKTDRPSSSAGVCSEGRTRHSDRVAVDREARRRGPSRSGQGGGAPPERTGNEGNIPLW